MSVNPGPAVPPDRAGSTYATHASQFPPLNAADTRSRELAWAEFHRRYAPIIAGFARNFGARAQEIDDVIQDVMVGFYSAAPSFVYDPARGRFRGYLKKCTWSALRRRLGVRARLRTVPIEDIDPSAPEVEGLWADAWARETLRTALLDVRERYERHGDARTFQAFERYVVLARPPQEVAAELGMSCDSVYAAKTRVTRALRERVRHLEAENG